MLFFYPYLLKRRRSYREGSYVYLTKLDKALCPNESVSQYFKKGNIRDNCQEYIFRGIITTRSHSKLRSCDKHISYTCVRENVIEGLKNVKAETKSSNIYRNLSCAKIILQIRLFRQVQQFCTVSHPVMQNVILESTETAPLQIILYFVFHSLSDG